MDRVAGRRQAEVITQVAVAAAQFIAGVVGGGAVTEAAVDTAFGGEQETDREALLPALGQMPRHQAPQDPLTPVGRGHPHPGEAPSGGLSISGECQLQFGTRGRTDDGLAVGRQPGGPGREHSLVDLDQFGIVGMPESLAYHADDVAQIALLCQADGVRRPVAGRAPGEPGRFLGRWRGGFLAVIVHLDYRSPGGLVPWQGYILAYGQPSAKGESLHLVIVAGSQLAEPLDVDLIDRADRLIAADGGADALRLVGRNPDLLVGDMDSIDHATLEALQGQGVEIRILPTAKDETDLESALRLAVELQAEEVTVFGALGGPRLDHLVATLLLLTAPWLTRMRVRLMDPWHEVYLAHGETLIEGAVGETLSLLPLSHQVREVWTEGLLYPLEGETLHQGTTRGVSNALTGEKAKVTHGAGRLLVMHYRRLETPSVHFRHS